MPCFVILMAAAAVMFSVPLLASVASIALVLAARRTRYNRRFGCVLSVWKINGDVGSTAFILVRLFCMSCLLLSCTCKLYVSQCWAKTNSFSSILAVGWFWWSFLFFCYSYCCCYVYEAGVSAFVEVFFECGVSDELYWTHYHCLCARDRLMRIAAHQEQFIASIERSYNESSTLLSPICCVCCKWEIHWNLFYVQPWLWTHRRWAIV